MNELTRQHLHSRAFIESYINKVSEDISIIRRIDKFISDRKFLDLPSTPEEMLGDWLQGKTFFSLQVIDSEILKLNEIDYTALEHLQSVWLRDVQRMKAFFIWEDNDKGSPLLNFYHACDDIRNKLITVNEIGSKHFQHIEQYIQEKYLGSDGKVDHTKPELQDLIREKAWIIYENTKHANQKHNWFLAQAYTTTFYENIIPAVKARNKESVRKILKAFQFGKSRWSSYPVITALEAAITIQFFDKVLLKNLLNDASSWDYSMAPVSYWQSTDNIRKIAGKKLVFDENEGQLIYEGIMPEDVRDKLKQALKSDEERVAIDMLYAESHIAPVQNLIM